MKNKTIIMVIILTTLFNVCLFSHINKYVLDRMLYDRTMITFQIYDQSMEQSEFIKKIQGFSEKNNIEIAQYNYLNSSDVAIYSTKKDGYDDFLLSFQKLYNKCVKTYDFDKVLSVGLKSNIYLNTRDSRVIQAFLDEFQNDCDMYYEESPYKGEGLISQIVPCVDFFSVAIWILFTFIMILMIFCNCIETKRTSIVYRVWGYKSTYIFRLINKDIFISIFITDVIFGLALVGILYDFAITNIVIYICKWLLIYNVLWFVIIVGLSYFLYRVLFLPVIGNKKFFLKITKMFYLLKIILLLLLFSFVNYFFESKALLEEKMNNLDSWMNTQDLFYINESNNPYNLLDLAIEKDYNDRIYKVYKHLLNEKKVFIINTNNFQHCSEENISTNIDDYVYKDNVKCEGDFFSPYGNNITVDTNYLRRYTLKGYNHVNILESIEDDKDTLNVIVPEKYKDKENIIIKNYKDWFYFYAVEVENMYREQCKDTLIIKKREDLKINIIYAENNQEIFTHNFYTGNEKNRIVDPLIMVYTGNINNSYLGACLSGYLIYEASSQNDALNELKQITSRYNVNELNNITSVYDQKGEEINNIHDNISMLQKDSIIMFLLVCIMTIIVWGGFCINNYDEILCKSLFGHGFINIFKRLILTNWIINMGVVLLAVFLYKKIVLYIVIAGACLMILDYLFTKYISYVLIRKCNVKLIKGDI